MFVARDSQGKLVHLLEEQELPRSNYFCPACGGALRFKNGQVMQPHFAHVSLESCAYSSENESQEHLTLKAQLFGWAKKDQKVEVEAFLAPLQQIADLLLEDRLALEVQCSPLSQERLRKRSQTYREHGYQVLWLLGEKLWLKQSLTPLQKDFLYFSQNLGFHLWELDVKKNVLRLKYLLHEDLHGKIQGREKVFPFGQGKLLDILRFPFKKQALTSFLAQADPEICRYIRQQLYYRNPKWMSLQAECYQRGENLLSKSVEDFYPQLRPIFSQQSFCQISQDLTSYYQNFTHYYQKANNKKLQILYPPAFYAYIKLST